MENDVNKGVLKDGTFYMTSYNPTVNEKIYHHYTIHVFFDDDDLTRNNYMPTIPNEKEKLTQIVITLYFPVTQDLLQVNYPIQDYSKAFDAVKSILQILHGTQYQPNNQPTFEDIIKQLETTGMKQVN